LLPLCASRSVGRFAELVLVVELKTHPTNGTPPSTIHEDTLKNG
jgi:hypothetical protein